MVNKWKLLTCKKELFVNVSLKTFFDSRGWCNHFHIKLCVWKVFYKVPGSFSTYSREYMRNILRYTAGKWTFLKFSILRHSKNSKYSIILFHVTHSVRMGDNDFEIGIWRLPIFAPQSPENECHKLASKCHKLASKCHKL